MQVYKLFYALKKKISSNFNIEEIFLINQPKPMKKNLLLIKFKKIVWNKKMKILLFQKEFMKYFFCENVMY